MTESPQRPTDPGSTEGSDGPEVTEHGEGGTAGLPHTVWDDEQEAREELADLDEG